MIPGRTAVPILLALSLTACASRAPVGPAAAAPAPAAPVDVDELIRVGCYRCLETAFATVEGRAPAAGFQVATLLVLRSKELGLPYTAWLTAAAKLAPPGAEWLLYLEIADVVRVDPLSGDREEILTLTASQRRAAETVEGWIEMLRRGEASPLFRAYLELTLACSAGQRQDAIDDAAARFPDVPLIEYRIGTCGSQAHLERVRERQPEYVDADLPLGRNALDTPQPDQEEALRRFRSARAAFPQSPLITAMMGDVHRAREEWEPALEAYDATLALVPTHRDALLGRTVALSNLGRPAEAIATATRLIDLGNWLIGGGYFWRAWNHFNNGDMEAARADVDQARTRSGSAPILVLSGMVAFRQRQLDLAEKEFSEALAVDAGQCEASALLGGVRAARQQWMQAVAAFEHAGQCFDLAIALRRKLIAEVIAGPGTPAGKAGQVARHERAIAEAEKHRGDATQNAAAIEKRLTGGSR